MAMMECSECHQQVSDKAEACPVCGNPIAVKPPVVVAASVRETGVGGALKWVVLLILLSCLGTCGMMVVAIAVPGFMRAKERAEAKKGVETEQVKNAKQTLAEVSGKLGPASAPAAPGAATAVPAAREAVSAVQWGEIDRVYNSKSKVTKLQKDEIWKQYAGKRVRWMGRVASVGETLGQLSMQVKMNADSYGSDVLVQLGEPEREKALKLMEGNVVQFTGTMKEWGSFMDVVLSDGEIEAVENKAVGANPTTPTAQAAAPATRATEYAGIRPLPVTAAPRGF